MSGTTTQTGLTLNFNPPHSSSYRDFSSTRGNITEYNDLFSVKHGVAPTPWITEQTLSYSSPAEYQERIRNCTLVHTGGNTDMAFTTHHTMERPKFPPGTVNVGTYTISRYLPTADPALQELHEAAAAVAPHMDDLLNALQSYHLHCNDGWITTSGFLVSCKKIGLQLSRGEFLAIERAIPKDTMGRINYHHVQHLVQYLTNPMPESGEEQGSAY